MAPKQNKFCTPNEALLQIAAGKNIGTLLQPAQAPLAAYSKHTNHL